MMKFAIPLAQRVLCAHFGHSEQFSIVTTQEGQIKGKELLTPPLHEPGALPRWLQELGVNVVIAGWIGRRAQDLFNQQGIKVVVGVPSDTPESLIKEYLEGTLVTAPNLCDH